MLLIGGWLGWIVRSARIQRKAVAAITRADGYATYDVNSNNKAFPWNRTLNWRKFIGEYIGIDYVLDVVGASVYVTTTTTTRIDSKLSLASWISPGLRN